MITHCDPLVYAHFYCYILPPLYFKFPQVISLVNQHIHYDNVYRAQFSALTAIELNQAYDNPARPDKYSAMSVDARQELDLKIGVRFCRVLSFVIWSVQTFI